MLEAIPNATASAHIASTPLVQKRAAAAGSIISPTASSVPSASNPPTRLSTTSTRKVVHERAGTADAAQEHRVDAFGNQRPPDQREAGEGYGGDAGDQHERLSSSASTVPNSTCIRSMLEPWIDTRSTPSASEIR